MTNILGNISVIIACITAIYGIISWRREHIGKRRIDISEEVLCSIYEIKDVIRYIRNPFGYIDEGLTRQQTIYETEEQKNILDRAYVVFERYEKQKDVFNNFYKLKYRYTANFGYKSEEPFTIIRKTINEIFSASQMLGRVYWAAHTRRRLPDEDEDTYFEKLEEYESIFWERDENDNINRKVDYAISTCESICKEANSLSFFKKIKLV